MCILALLFERNPKQSFQLPAIHVKSSGSGFSFFGLAPSREILSQRRRRILDFSFAPAFRFRFRFPSFFFRNKSGIGLILKSEIDGGQRYFGDVENRDFAKNKSYLTTSIIRTNSHFIDYTNEGLWPFCVI